MWRTYKHFWLFPKGFLLGSLIPGDKQGEGEITKEKSKKHTFSREIPQINCSNNLVSCYSSPLNMSI